MTLKYHWLVAGNVIAAGPKDHVGQKGLNALLTTDEPFFTRDDLATAQKALMQRFITETKVAKDSKIVDVFVISVNNLGQMDPVVFNGSFAAEEQAAEGQK